MNLLRVLNACATGRKTRFDYVVLALLWLNGLLISSSWTHNLALGA